MTPANPLGERAFAVVAASQDPLNAADVAAALGCIEADASRALWLLGRRVCGRIIQFRRHGVEVRYVHARGDEMPSGCGCTNCADANEYLDGFLAGRRITKAQIAKLDPDVDALMAEFGSLLEDIAEQINAESHSAERPSKRRHT